MDSVTGALSNSIPTCQGVCQCSGSVNNNNNNSRGHVCKLPECVGLELDMHHSMESSPQHSQVDSVLPKQALWQMALDQWLLWASIPPSVKWAR